MSDKFAEVIEAALAFNTNKTEAAGKKLAEMVLEWTKAIPSAPSDMLWEYLGSYHALIDANTRMVLAEVRSAKESGWHTTLPGVRGLWISSSFAQAQATAEGLVNKDRKSNAR